jgi:hypothetical protein
MEVIHRVTMTFPWWVPRRALFESAYYCGAVTIGPVPLSFTIIAVEALVRLSIIRWDVAGGYYTEYLIKTCQLKMHDISTTDKHFCGR